MWLISYITVTKRLFLLQHIVLAHPFTATGSEAIDKEQGAWKAYEQ